jgi:CheY-like chemotaxis protein/nitrogen-specific signal transduction histidine kinase
MDYEEFLMQFSPDILMQFLESVETLKRHEKVADRIEFLDPAGDGDWKHFLLGTGGIYDNQGAYIGVVICYTDITNFLKAQEAAIEASKAKGRVLANMSHEIRTPLNTVIGLAITELAQPDLGEHAKGTLQKINRAGNMLLSLVNDVLDFSKIEAGKFDIVPVEYDTAELINDAIFLNKPRIGDKAIDFRLSVQEGLPSRLVGDDVRIRQILNNLLSNAIKYTQSGFVELSVEFEPTQNDQLWLLFAVADSGMGLAPDEMGHLFENYGQLDKKANRKIESTGLGLPITKRLVELMGGTIEVESEHGKGSVFLVRLPQKLVEIAPIGKRVQTAVEEHKTTQFERVQMPGRSVLVTDDMEINIDVASAMLEMYGITVDGAESGQEALDKLKANPDKYSMVFMDHMMPGMDGVEATKRIREFDKLIPVIALTANAIGGVDKMFLNSGFNGYLAKPIDPWKLDATLKKWIQR